MVHVPPFTIVPLLAKCTIIYISATQELSIETKQNIFAGCCVGRAAIQLLRARHLGWFNAFISGGINTQSERTGVSG